MKKARMLITIIICIGVFSLNSGAISSVHGINDPWLQVIVPNGGEQWSDFQMILWDCGGEIPILPVFFNLYYMRLNEFWQPIITDYTNEENSFLWNTQSVSNGQYLIKVELWLDTDLNGDGDSLYLDDTSDNWFTIDNNGSSDDIPPIVGMTKPKRALYFNDWEIIPLSTCVIFGYVQIWPYAYDNESGLKLLEIYINNELKANFTSTPKSWIWGEFCFGKYIIKLTAYDYANNNASFEIIVWKFF